MHSLRKLIRVILEKALLNLLGLQNAASCHLTSVTKEICTKNLPASGAQHAFLATEAADQSSFPLIKDSSSTAHWFLHLSGKSLCPTCGVFHMIGGEV